MSTNNKQTPPPFPRDGALSKPPPLTENELQVAFREGATDGEVESTLRHLVFWSYLVRNPMGKVCAAGRGNRADCIRNAFELADAHAIDAFSTLDEEQEESQALNGAWRLVLWPPWFDPDPLFWAASSSVFDED